MTATVAEKLEQPATKETNLTFPAVTAPPSDPFTILAVMVNRGASADELGKMMDLVERHRKWEAEKAFNDDMAEVHRLAPAVLKSAKGQNNNYAPLEEVLLVYRPIYSPLGFSVSFGEDHTSPLATICTMYIDVQHKMGHVKRHYGRYPIDKSGSMNVVQGVVSSHSYAQRDLFCMAFAVTKIGLDQDGNTSDLDCITEKEADQLAELMEEKRVNYDQFFKWVREAAKIQNISKLDEIPRSLFPKALDMLKRKQVAK